MKKKITISIDERELDWAKGRAREENRTLSNWIETFIVQDELDHFDEINKFAKDLSAESKEGKK